MGFTQQTFMFIVLPLSIVLYCGVGLTGKLKIQNVILLCLSILFYAWSSLDTLILFISLSVFFYLIGYVGYLNSLTDNGIKVNISKVAILLLAPLCYFKYSQFIVEIINTLTHTNINFESVLVPIGISFVTFEGISYVVDVYRGYVIPGSYFEFLFYLSFFPKIVSGPIVLFRDFKPQICNRKTDIEAISYGFQRIIIGYAEKAIIADTFGATIASIYIPYADTATIWIRGILYFFEIYFDFAGYSNIAIGLSNIFGFTIKENFNKPYISISITDFWRRWHISLGTFFREYVYIPLGGNRTGNVYIHLFIVFLLTGLWHGANFTFIIWGVIHGLFVVIERLLHGKVWYQKVPKIFKWFCTIVIIYFTWILFSSQNIIEALEIYKRMFMESNITVNFEWKYYLTKKIVTLLIIAAAVSFVPIEVLLKKYIWIKESLLWLILKRVLLIVLLLVDVLFVVNSNYSPFMYFQF